MNEAADADDLNSWLFKMRVSFRQIRRVHVADAAMMGLIATAELETMYFWNHHV